MIPQAQPEPDEDERAEPDCPECDTGHVVVDGVECGYTLAHCSNHCGWTS
jgi:hypothetical protein